MPKSLKSGEKIIVFLLLSALTIGITWLLFLNDNGFMEVGTSMGTVFVINGLIISFIWTRIFKKSS